MPITLPQRNWHTGRMTLVAGASQSGKTHWTKKQIKDAKRLIIWDREAQYADCVDMLVGDMRELKAMIKRNPKGFKVAFVPPRVDKSDLMLIFKEWCDCAFALADLSCSHHGGDYSKIKTVIVAEELAGVSNPAKAPLGWDNLLTTGLKRNAHIYGIMQRPAECDKTILGNCTDIHCHGLGRKKDRVYMAEEMDIQESVLASLDRSKFEYLHKDMRSGKLDRG